MLYILNLLGGCKYKIYTKTSCPGENFVFTHKIYNMKHVFHF